MQFDSFSAFYPSYKLTEAFDTTFSLEKLNQGDYFEYEQKEGDNLFIQNGFIFNRRGKKLACNDVFPEYSFILKQGKWVPDYYVGGAHCQREEIIKQGLIEIIKSCESEVKI